MTIRVGQKIAEIDDSYVWDSELTVESVEGEFESLRAAESRAADLARDPNRDAAVLRDGDRFVVVTTQEIGSLQGSATNRSLHEGARQLVSAFKGNSAGVSLIKSSDNSTISDGGYLLLRTAGLNPAEVDSIMSGELTPDGAAHLMTSLFPAPGRP